MANAKELARLEKIEKDNRKEADKAEEDAMNLASGSKKKITQDNYAKTLNSIADIAHGRAQAQRDKMNPDEIAAGETMRAAQESKNAAEEIGDKHSEAVQKWLSNKTNSPAVVAAQLANIDLKAKDESLNKKEGSNGYSLNSQQRIGAYAATAPVLLQQLSVLHSIDRKVTPQHPPSNRPPGERPPQIGSNPQGARNWLHSH